MINQSILESVLAPQFYHSGCSYNEALYLELRRLYVSTSGDHNWLINKHISRKRPIRSLLVNAIHGLLPLKQIQTAVTSLFQSGYCVTSIDLPSNYYKEIISLVKSKSCKDNLSSARLFLDNWKDLSSSSLVQTLLSDPSIKYIADQ